MPVIRGVIRRRLLVNYRVDANVVRRFVPEPFEPKLHAGFAIAGICLIRIEEIRPAGVPKFFGTASENAAHRIAVTWTDAHGNHREGVYIPRRDTGSLMNHFAGGRVFPGEHHLSNFDVRDDGSHLDFAMLSRDRQVVISLIAEAGDALPDSSCFGAVDEASRFFEGGCAGYSVTRDPHRLDGIRLETRDWQVRPLAVKSVRSSFFENPALFPKGSVQFDHALIMRDVPHEWHTEPDLACTPRGSVSAAA
jgi:hypothetical protein